MLNAEARQFRLSDDGRIFYQADKTNPLPGEPVAKLRKGQGALAPDIDLTLSGLADEAAAREFLRGWLKAHIATTLEPLMALENTEGMAGPARGICFQIFENMGVVPREKLEDLIAGLDPAMRQTLRDKKARLGPILVFLPALNKPAGVRLRAVLWALWNDKTLPAAVPPDGSVSVRVEAGPDKAFYQAIGYPVFGPRAIRIDMLDRVINAVYDGAKDGKFRAEHKMAEWLGCSLEDLYAILEAMGHRKISEPAPAEQKEEKKEDAAPAESAGEAAPSAAPPAKPLLSEFWLKKGKAFQKRPEKPKTFKEGEKRVKKSKPKDGKRHKEEDRSPRVITIDAGGGKSAADSPFAILAQLKNKNVQGS